MGRHSLHVPGVHISAKRLASPMPAPHPAKRMASKAVTTVHMDEQTVHDSHFSTSAKRMAKKAPVMSPVKRLAKKPDRMPPPGFKRAPGVTGTNKHSSPYVPS